MERGCGDFKRNLRSRSAPWSNLDKRVLHSAYLDQLGSRYNLEDELSEVGKRPKGTLLRKEVEKDGCECILISYCSNVRESDCNCIR
jgi:hypothetical protein